jgi:hypothetical protein
LSTSQEFQVAAASVDVEIPRNQLRNAEIMFIILYDAPAGIALLNGVHLACIRHAELSIGAGKISAACL